MSKHQQGCILVACVVSMVPSHIVCGTHNQPATNGGRKSTLLRDTGDRRVNSTTATMRHTEHTVTLTVTVPGQSECALVPTLTIPLTPNQRQEEDGLGIDLPCHKHIPQCRHLPGCTGRHPKEPTGKRCQLTWPEYSRPKPSLCQITRDTNVSPTH